jgi:DNA (cytosine-5)-methyltransferase 1
MLKNNQLELLNPAPIPIKVSPSHTKKSKNLSTWTFIDLFAGIGGIRQGFSPYFGKCVFSSEWDKFSQQTYQANFDHCPVGDITQISPHDIPPFDILLAGFPCQPFSNAGHKKGFSDTRGTLFFNILEIAKYHRPQVLFLENVKGFKSHNKGDTFKTVKYCLEAIGYTVYAQVLNAKDFGVPQNRERIYIIAFLTPIKFSYPIPPKKAVKVGDILEPIVDKKYTISDKLWAGHQRRKLAHKAKGNGFGYSMFNAESSYTSTISARYYKDGSEILLEQKNQNPRKITPREAARLQGFPEDFQIPVSDTQAYRQFGNSVSIPVISALADSIYQALKTHHRDHKKD